MNKFIDRIRQKAIRKLGGYVEPFPGPQQQLFEYRRVCIPETIRTGYTVRFNFPEERVKEILAEQFAHILYAKGYIKTVRSEGVVPGSVEYNAYLKVIKEE